ncbi:sensor histidine kinase [Paenibacillus sp. J5C_2022]|uniref:sensor histidine kinase n=1 Tax=Paenibacillus sp. J5C2022 TaxID=2977129 RepID=UPI0021CF38CA|nr:sensor histidine kinase [Paenibacillus sp. J5C2022]MCU6711792.1 sensor histidine kinase [Paenibacillus sp. J5C2022]
MSISTVNTLSNTKVSRLFFYGLACSYVILLLLFNVLSHFKGLAIVALLIGLYFFRHSKPVLSQPKYRLVAAVSPVTEIVLLFMLFLQSGTEIEGIALIIFAADIILHYKAWYALPLVYGGYLTYIFIWSADGEIWGNVFDILSFSCLVVPIWATKLLLNQREMSLRLNEALVQEARMREEMAALKERSRIAEEVHDTVGHTLTTAIVALEGAQLLFDKKPEEVYWKILVARQQMKQGLGDIRQVVKALKAEKGIGGSGLGLEEGIKLLIADTSKQTGVQFAFYYEVAAPLISLQEYVMSSAIKESITNALKHGIATRIEISIREREETIHMTVKDNGEGSDPIVYGFGLNTMANRIEAIGGQFSVSSESGKGFVVEIRMPVARGLPNE